MEERHELFAATSLTITPTRSREGFGAEIADAAGNPLATCEPDGSVRDRSGRVVLGAQVRWEGPRHGPAKVEMDIADGDGRTLGSGRVVKYGLGPRAKKATVSLRNPEDQEVARLEPSDKKGERLSIRSEAGDFATIDVAQVKKGFLSKSRVYTVSLFGAIPDELRPSVLAAAIRYDALIKALEAASLHQSARD